MLELFRNIEKKVMGAEAASVRARAVAWAIEQKTRQISLLDAPQPTDSHYDSLHAHGLTMAASSGARAEGLIA